MKKFTVILFLLIFPINSIAHMGHYNKYNKIEMEIFRNGKLIGYNYYFLRDKEKKQLSQINLNFLLIFWVPQFLRSSLMVKKNILKIK